MGKRVSRKVLRRRQLAALAVIAFIVLLFFILIAKGCSKSDDDKTDNKKNTPAVTTTAATVVTTAPPTEATTEAVTTQNPKASNVKLSTRELFLDVGEKDVAIIQSYPDAGTTEADEVWKSLDPSIASVDQYGYVTGVSKGQTYIVLSFKNYPDIEIEIKVNVADDGSSPAVTTSLVTGAGAGGLTGTTTAANAGIA